MSQTIAQKMTDHEFTAAIDSKVARDMTSSALTFATDEALRARSEEARLLEETKRLRAKVDMRGEVIAKTQRTIAAMADTLESVQRACGPVAASSFGALGYDVMAKVSAAIRLDNGHESSDMANEAASARREEAQLQDRLHALEVHQAELIRQLKEKDDTLMAIGERLVAAGASRGGTMLESLNAVLARQAEQITALADALWDARQYGDDEGELCWCQSPCGPGFVHGRRPECEAKEAALRLSGRVT